MVRGLKPCQCPASFDKRGFEVKIIKKIIMIPKKLKQDKPQYHSFILDENDKAICTVIVSDYKQEIKEEIIKRYNDHEDLKFTAKLSAWFGAIATVAFCVLFIYLQSNPPR